MRRLALLGTLVACLMALELFVAGNRCWTLRRQRHDLLHDEQAENDVSAPCRFESPAGSVQTNRTPPHVISEQARPVPEVDRGMKYDELENRMRRRLQR